MSASKYWFHNTVSLAVVIVGALTFFLIVGCIVLLGMDREPPEGLIAVMGSGVGALATLLVSRPTDQPNTEEGREDGVES